MAPADINIELIWSQFTEGIIYVLAVIFVIDALSSIYKGLKYKLSF
jgi:hypothetical protein